MPSCWKKFFPAKAISRLRRLFFRPRQDEGRVAQASEENLILIVVDEDQISQTAEDALPPPSTASQPNEDSEPQLAEAVQRGQPLLPPNCSELQPEHIEILGNFPTRSGAFADVWDGSLAGTRVAIKSYRTYSATDPTQARMRFYKEALACSQLSHQNVVPFRAAYITPKHPLALVYDLMEHRDLREYLRSGGGIKRVRLLADIARGLSHMHDMGIVHGNIRTDNVLVDANGTARIAGLGSAFIPSQNHAAWSAMDAELLFYGTAPELVRPRPPKSRAKTTKGSDIYAFAVLAWEVFAGQVPFSPMRRLVAIHLLVSGDRPPRPRHPELSDRVWDVIEKCWHGDPSRRIPIKAVVAILEGELLRNASG